VTIRSSIDLGTNTCLLLVVEKDSSAPDGFRQVADYSTIVRLGEGVDKTRELQPAAMERTLGCLREYARRLRDAGGKPEETIAVSTASARDARNGGEFFERVKRETGFVFRTISGDEEARLTFLGGLLPGCAPESSAVIDIGGGSTEIIGGGGGQSVNLGSVRFTERFLKSDPVTDEEFWACQAAIDELLEPLAAWRSRQPEAMKLVAVAGTATTLAQWQLALPQFDARAIDEVTLTRGDVHRMVEELKWRTVTERCAIAGMEPKRADVILAGAMILWRAMELLRFPDCRVSTRGLRYGVLKG
jgi:exopolyphosphatase/guanosine-5'-triphosphate,3'-diphosphate pyrophosphatase